MNNLFIPCAYRQPTVTGLYKILNNSSCNNGEGELNFILGKGWQIPEAIKDFYRVIGWQEKVKNEKISNR